MKVGGGKLIILFNNFEQEHQIVCKYVGFLIHWMYLFKKKKRYIIITNNRDYPVVW